MVLIHRHDLSCQCVDVPVALLTQFRHSFAKLDGNIFLMSILHKFYVSKEEKVDGREKKHDNTNLKSHKPHKKKRKLIIR